MPPVRPARVRGRTPKSCPSTSLDAADSSSGPRSTSGLSVGESRAERVLRWLSWMFGWKQESTTNRSRRTLLRVGNGPTTRESDMHVFCNSNDVSIAGDFVVTNVSGDMIVDISAEDLRALVSELRAVTPVPRNIGNSSANSFILTDALGEDMTLGFSSVQTFEGLKRFLVFHFDGKVGEKQVRDGAYCIMTARDGREVSPENWEEVYEAREPMIMAVLTQDFYESKMRLECPKCGKTKLGVVQNGAQRLCRKCNTGFFQPLTTEPDKFLTDFDDMLDVRGFRHIRRAGMTIEQITDKLREGMRELDDEDSRRDLRISDLIREEWENRQKAMEGGTWQEGNSDASRFQELGD